MNFIFLFILTRVDLIGYRFINFHFEIIDFGSSELVLAFVKNMHSGLPKGYHDMVILPNTIGGESIDIPCKDWAFTDLPLAFIKDVSDSLFIVAPEQ